MLLKKGDTIGVIAPSSPIEDKDIEKINESIKLMEEFGFKIKFSKNFYNNTFGYSATPQEKAADINEMFADKEVKAIFAATGGANSNGVFDYLDYKLIKENSKILCGFSDTTSILNVINHKTGLITYHGPTFKSLTSWETDYAYRQVIKKFVNNEWDFFEKGEELFVVQPGTAEGKLIGGNLSMINNLCSGKYKVDFKDKILFIEELSFESYPELVSNYLYNMKQNGVFDNIKGVWVGNYNGEVPLENILLDVLDGEYSFPIVKSNNFGHVDNKQIIPIGGMARISSCCVELLEKTY